MFIHDRVKVCPECLREFFAENYDTSQIKRCVLHPYTSIGAYTVTCAPECGYTLHTPVTCSTCDAALLAAARGRIVSYIRVAGPEYCLESYPCQHDVTVKYENGDIDTVLYTAPQVLRLPLVEPLTASMRQHCLS